VEIGMVSGRAGTPAHADTGGHRQSGYFLHLECKDIFSIDETSLWEYVIVGVGCMLLIRP